MLGKDCWRKKFSLGLVLDTTLDEFRDFLTEYHDYIENFYFSLPLGDRFHSRTKVVKQFHDSAKIRQFWDQLHMIHDFGIKLEVLFNTRGCVPEDFVTARDLMQEHGIDPEKVGFIDTYYDLICQVFPGKEYVFSFNNRPANANVFLSCGHAYHEYVLGRQFIRDTRLMEAIHVQLDSKVVLLANNGCSHICGGCSTHQHCLFSYRKARDSHSPEYLYALQSVLPFEFHEGLLDLDKIDYIKINSRNTNIRYLKECVQSYIEGNEEQWLEKDKNSWSFWGSLSWHVLYYGEFDLERVKDLKRNEIYRRTPSGQHEAADRTKIWMDLTDRLIFEGQEKERLESAYLSCKKELAANYGGELGAVCLGIRACRFLLSHIDTSALLSLMEIIRADGKMLFFVLPPLMEEDCLLYLKLEAECGLEQYIDAVFVSDTDTLKFLSGRSLLPVLVGSEIAEYAPSGQPVILEEASQYENIHKGAGQDAVPYVLQYPETKVCRGICNLKHAACRKECCEQPECLSVMGRRFHGDLPDVLKLQLRGDLLYTCMEDDSNILHTVSDSRYPLLLTPSFISTGR